MTLLKASADIHGHVCPGQVLGVRMSMLGLRLIDIDDPRGRDKKNIIVYVEMDRCATDAVQSVTGVSLGKRTMKFMDYGKMAATYLNIKTNQAVRIVALEEARDKARQMFPQADDKYAAQIEAYKILPDDELFKVMEVRLSMPMQDAPGRPVTRVRCASCGEHVQDMREVMHEGKAVCRPCAGGSYYELKGAADV